jgi:DNA-binding SARP family transcriptional activator
MADDQTVPDLARLLRQLRRREARRRGTPELTYRELAAKTGWSLGIIAQYFSGKTLPPFDRFDVLVRLLGASSAEQGELATTRDRVDEHRRRLAPPGKEAGSRYGIRLLGPVEAVGPDGVAKLVGVRQRALVGLLALNAGRTVPQSRMVDALWGEDPPRTAVQTLYSHVARVRQALDACGLRGVLRTRESGYLLAVQPEQVDATRFEQRVAQARTAIAGGTVNEAVTHLREGLALWRGDALADAATHGWAASEVDRLHEVRLTAQEDLWEARLRLGEHAGAVGELERLLVSRPGRERLVGLLMLALYRCGRPAEAIQVYQRLRAHLADQLGVEPSPEVQRQYTAILRRDPDLDPATSGVPPATVRPAQLPPPAGHFTGRTPELAILNRLLGDRPRIGVVSGPAGMGKTALAVQWAHLAADRFIDGQLFLDLRGHDPATALPVSDALTHLLAGLGVPPAQIPAHPAAQLGLYRSVLHQRRMLVLLDNAASAEQVNPLVPPSSTSLLVVTSRHRLAGLAVDHAVSAVDLDVLPAGDALALLRRILGAGRVTGEPAAADRLVELCDRLPLALRIAAAKLTVRPGQHIAALVDDLTEDRLDALTVPGDSRSIRTVFAGAYLALSPAAARLFRRLGQHPGPTFTAGLAAALEGTPLPQVRSTLDELVAAHLVAEMADRYRFHDLIGAYAHECAAPAEAERTTARIIDWYLTVADRANRVLDPTRDQAGPVPADPPVEEPFLPNHEQALSFLDAERHNLLPVARHIAGREHHQAAWRLTYLLAGYLSIGGQWSAQIEIGRLGLAAAQRLADPAAESLMRSLLGAACNAIQQYDEALEHLGVALDLMRTTEDVRGQGKAYNNLAFTYVRLGRYDEAMEAFREALALYEADHHQPGIALTLNNLGHTHTLKGWPDRAMAYLSRALTLARELDHPGLEARTLHSLGEARLAAADHDGALARFAAALAIRRRIGERRLAADTLNLIGLTHQARGDHAAAAGHFRRALALARELGDRHLEATTLAYLDAGPPGSGAPDGDYRGPVGDQADRRREDPDTELQARRMLW